MLSDVDATDFNVRLLGRPIEINVPSRVCVTEFATEGSSTRRSARVIEAERNFVTLRAQLVSRRTAVRMGLIAPRQLENLYVDVCSSDADADADDGDNREITAEMKI